SIPMGVWAAMNRNRLYDRGSAIALFVLYSLPSFFAGTLLLVVFANPDVLHWFPESGVQDPLTFNSDWSWFEKVAHRIPYLVLPLVTYTYFSFAFLSRQLRISMLDVLRQDFITTARAKGLSER